MAILDASRFPSGTLLNVSSLTDARPVGTLVRYETDGLFYVSTNATVATYSVLSSAAVTTVLDSLFRIVNASDPTKQLAFSAANITAGQTRTITAPDFNFNLAQQGIIPPTGITDPGTGAAIPVTKSGYLALTIGAGAETNTLALFPAIGQTMFIQATVVGAGTREITAAGPLNPAGNTVMTFNALGDYILIMGYGPGYIILVNNSVTLS